MTYENLDSCNRVFSAIPKPVPCAFARLLKSKSDVVALLLKSKDRPLDSAAEQLERCGLDWKHRKEQLFKSMHRAHKVHHTNKVLCELLTKIGLYSDKDCTKIDWYPCNAIYPL